jgi:hypothetical protein
MPSRPGRRTSQLELAVALTLVALFVGWWATRLVAAQADVRILRVKEMATAMRMLSREVRLQALVAQQGDVTGMIRTDHGNIEMLDGHPTARADGIGRLMAVHAPARQMSCAAVPVPDPARRGQWLDAFECAPAELTGAARERCAARYLAPLWPGGEPTVTFLFHSKRLAGLPCELD